MREQSFVGVGEFFIRRLGSTEGPLSIGNVSAATVEFQENTREIQDSTRPGGGLANSLTRITGATASFTLRDFDPRNLALALAGTRTEVEAGSVTAEPVTAKGEFIPLPHTDLSNVVVDSDPSGTTYNDFEIMGAGIRPTDGGDLAQAIEAAAGSGVELLIDYDYGNHDVIEALTQSGQEYEVTFAGYNDAQGGAQLSITMWRAKFSPTQNLSLITESDFGELQVSARLLKDSGRGAGESAYMKQRMTRLS